MKVVTLNVNGLVNAAERGFFEWLEKLDADVVCVQEVRAREYQLPEAFLNVPGYHAFFFEADEDSYSGTAIYSRVMPKAIIRGLGSPQWDMEGRFIQADFNNVSIASIAVPYAQTEDEIEHKLAFLEVLQQHMKKTRRKRREFIFAGSYQIAHRSIDLGNWETHQRESGFLPEERAWMDQVTGPIGFVDAFRLMNRKDRQHTWWPFDEAQANGMRLDYQMITPNIADFVLDVGILREPRISPHLPVVIEYDIDF